MSERTTESRERRAEIQAGLAFIFSVIVLVGGVLWFKNFRIGAKNVKIQVEFPNTSGLVRGDPVEIRGVPSGQVDEIRVEGGGARVVMQVKRNVKLHENAEFVVKNVGIMGQKMIAVDPGSPEVPLASEGMLFRGTYEPGIPEFIANLGNVVDTFGRLGNRLDSVLGSLQGGDKRSLTNTLENLEVVTADLRTFFVETRGDLSGSVRNFNVAMTTLNRTFEGRDREIGELIDNTARASAHFDSSLTAFQETAAAAESLLHAIQDGNGSAAKLLRDDDLYQDLRETLADTRALVQDMKAHPHRYVKLSLF
jgi:phospholipid/cholesterol/gamma-HCH transport system substrate-binding protein